MSRHPKAQTCLRIPKTVFAHFIFSDGLAVRPYLFTSRNFYCRTADDEREGLNITHRLAPVFTGNCCPVQVAMMDTGLLHSLAPMLPPMARARTL